MADLAAQVAKTVGRHFVTLSCVQYPPAEAQPKTLVFSGFVVAILGEWFYVTAGHILQLINTAISTGSEFDRRRLDDQTAGNRFSGKAVPYDFSMERWLVLQDDSQGLDYAIVHLPQFYRRQLEAGGATPIERKIWSNHGEPADYWLMVGIPSESVTFDGESVITASVVMAPLQPAETPYIAGQKAANQFYAVLMDGSEAYFADADGFSGGPVFALKQVEGRWAYGVIGVQSAWYRSTKTMAICPFASFALALESVVAETLAEYKNGANALGQ
jgi:hypothetical protein